MKKEENCNKFIPAMNSETGEMKLLNIKDIDFSSPIRHENLPEPLRVRIKNIHKVLSEVEGRSFLEFEESFKHETHPDREVGVYEVIVKTYSTFINRKFFSIKKKMNIYILIIKISLGFPYFTIMQGIKHVSAYELNSLYEQWGNNFKSYYNISEK